MAWRSEVGKTGSPWKKVWLSVYDLPSPVLPKMDTTCHAKL